MVQRLCFKQLVHKHVHLANAQSKYPVLFSSERYFMLRAQSIISLQPVCTQQKISTIKSDLEEKDQALLDARQESRESCDRMLADLTASEGQVNSLKDEVEAKARQIAFQKEQMAGLAAKIKNNATETDSNAALEKELQEAQEVAATATELAETTAAQADAKMREMMKEQEQTLLTHAQEMQAVQDESSQKLDAFKSQVAELQQQIEQQEAQQEAQHEAAATATELAENAAAQADAKMREIMNEHEQTLLIHTQEMEEMQSFQDERLRDFGAVKDQVAELQHQIEQQKAQHEADLDIIREQHANALAQQTDVDAAETTTNDELQQTNLELQMEIEHQQSVLCNMNDEKKSLTERTEELSEQVAGLQAELEQQQHTAQERQDKMQHKLEQIRASAVNEVSQAEDKLQEVEKLLDEESKQVKHLTQQLTEATGDKTRASELQEELTAVTTELSEHKQQAADARAAIVEKAQQQVNLVKKEAQKVVTRLQSQLQELHAQATAKEENVQMLTSALAQARQETLQRQNQADEAAIAQLEHKLKEAQSELEERKLENEQAQVRIGKLEKSKLTTEWVQHVQGLNKDRRSLASANKRLTAKLKAALKQVESSKNTANKEDPAAAKEVQHLRAMVGEYETKLSQHAEYVQQLESKETDLKKLLQETRAQAVAASSDDNSAEALQEAKYKLQKYQRKLSKRETQLTDVTQLLKGMKQENKVSSLGSSFFTFPRKENCVGRPGY